MSNSYKEYASKEYVDNKVPSAVATTETDGLMSAADKAKLDTVPTSTNIATKEYVNGRSCPAVTTTGTGEAYEATIDGISELTNGFSFIMIPHTSSTVGYPNPTLNVNGLGAYPIFLVNAYQSSAHALSVFPTAILQKESYYRMVYFDNIWIVENVPVIHAELIKDGILPISYGGTGYNQIVDTTYTVARYRASALVSTETNPTKNGVINWNYE